MSSCMKLLSKHMNGTSSHPYGFDNACVYLSRLFKECLYHMLYYLCHSGKFQDLQLS